MCTKIHAYYKASFVKKIHKSELIKFTQFKGAIIII